MCLNFKKFYIITIKLSNFKLIKEILIETIVTKILLINGYITKFKH